MCNRRSIVIPNLAAAMICGICVTGFAEHNTERDFGVEMPIVRSLGLGGSMDATVKDSKLYVIGRGNLHVADVSQQDRRAAAIHAESDTLDVVYVLDVALAPHHELGLGHLEHAAAHLVIAPLHRGTDLRDRDVRIFRR